MIQDARNNSYRESEIRHARSYAAAQLSSPSNRWVASRSRPRGWASGNRQSASTSSGWRPRSARKLLARDTHKVVLTGDGEALACRMRGPCFPSKGRCSRFSRATACAAACGSACRKISSPASLPAVLEDFVRSHPSVDLELTVALVGRALRDAGQWRDRSRARQAPARRCARQARLSRAAGLAGARSRTCAGARGLLPLIAFPAPSVTRSDRAGSARAKRRCRGGSSAPAAA